MRALRIAGGALAALVLVFLVLVGLVWAAGNSGVGRRVLAGVVDRATAGQVKMSGIAGHFPDRVKVARVELRDEDGGWLRLDDVALDWSPAALLHGEVEIDRLMAQRAALDRMPANAAVSGTPQETNFGLADLDLPVRVAVRQLGIARLELGAAVAGTPGVFAATGTAALTGREQGVAKLDLARIDAAGAYELTARLDPGGAHLAAVLHEDAGGFIGKAAGVPDLPGLDVSAALDGPVTASTLAVRLRAGPLHADARGRLNLVTRAGELRVDAGAPAMRPSAALGWDSIAISGQVHSSLSQAAGTARIDIAGLAASGASAGRVHADVSAVDGVLTLDGGLEGVRLPGPNPTLLAGAPVIVHGVVGLGSGRVTEVRIAHPLLQVEGDGAIFPSVSASLRLRLPDLAPLVALGGATAVGGAHATLHLAQAGGDWSLEMDGKLGLTGGPPQALALLGQATQVHAEATLGDGSATLRELRVDGAKLRVTASGAERDGRMSLGWSVELPDLAALQPTLAGALRATGTTRGTPGSFDAEAALDGEVNVPGKAGGTLHAGLAATGLPDAPDGSLSATGVLAGAPVHLAASVRRAADGALRGDISQADWQSAHAEGAFTWPAGGGLPDGSLTVRMGRLADLAPLIGQAIAGSLDAKLASGAGQTRLVAEVMQAGVPGSRIGQLNIDATLSGGTGDAAPRASATINARGIDAGGVTGNAHLEMNGPADALATKLSVDLPALAGAPVRLAADGLVDASTRTARLDHLAADWKTASARLVAPARVKFGAAIGVDRLRLALAAPRVAAASVEVAGDVTPRLDLTVALRDVSAGLAAIAAPGLAVDGVFNADARMGGTLQAPTGTVKLAGNGLRMRGGAWGSLPAASLAASAQLQGRQADFDARMALGATRIAARGAAPLGSAGALSVRLTGGADLALTDPLLTPAGRRLRGRLALDATLSGDVAAPRIAGNVTLASGEFQDFTQGVHLTALSGEVVADGETLRLVRLDGKAGDGTLAARGTVGLARPMPVALNLTVRGARMPASDELTATLDADLGLRGDVDGRLAATGGVTISRAEVRIPEKLPTKVATLNVTRLGARPAAVGAPGDGASTGSALPDVALDLSVKAAQAIFVRGRGANAEFSGEVKVGGTLSAPRPSGGFTLRRGTFALAGHTLTLTHGTVDFTGAGLEPQVDLEATTTAGSTTATFKVSGPANALKIALSSVPEMPQDEILGEIFFGRPANELSPFQLAEIATTLASFSGVDTGIGNPLDQVRSGLGLDVLSVGAASTGSGATLEAGHYVSSGVYVGAKQGTGGTDTTQATVQIDITKGLKVQTDVGPGRSGNSLGLTYQFEY